jgi:hypothetical protein
MSDINTNTRLFDLGRQMRVELHRADLITDDEYAWLSGGSPMATSKDGGSPSPRRLEDYDELLTKNREQAAEIVRLRAAETAIDKPRWIRVEDALPEGDVPVWLCLNGPLTEILVIGCRSDSRDGWLWCKCYLDYYWDYTTKKWVTDTAEEGDDKPTHWMHLPTPPADTYAKEAK